MDGRNKLKSYYDSQKFTMFRNAKYSYNKISVKKTEKYHVKA